MDAVQVKNRDYSQKDHPVQINREGHNDGHFGGNSGRRGGMQVPPLCGVEKPLMRTKLQGNGQNRKNDVRLHYRSKMV